MTFSLRGASIPTNGSGIILITDIPIGYIIEDALICRSEIPSSELGNWYLHPTQLSTDGNDRIVSGINNGEPYRGWHRNRATDSEGRRLVRLWRDSDTADHEEGVFTCHIPGDSSTPRYLYITYPGEL